MNRSRNLVICIAFAILVSFALAFVHPFGDVALYTGQSVSTPILAHSQIPSAARSVLIAKCADCHSDQIHAPFYRHFAPFSWLMERDIVKGRKAMNLSQWDSYSAEQQQTLMDQIVHETKTHQMPPLQYRMIHWGAHITDADLAALGQLANKSEMGSAISAGDPVRGKQLFDKRCTKCHAMDRNRQGPQLQGIYGHTSGTVTGFDYSAALKKAQIVWDDNSLDKWLANPDAFVPGSDMDSRVLKPQDRRDLISYMKQSSGK